MSNSLKLSPKYGVNPSVIVCPICGKETGLAMLGKLKGDTEAPRTVAGDELCDSCKKEINDNKVAILEANGTYQGLPRYTGRYVFVPKDCIKRDSKILFMDKEDFINTFERNKED